MDAPEPAGLWREPQNVTDAVKAPTYAELQEELMRVKLEALGLRLPFLALVDALGGEVTIRADDIVKANGMAFVMTPGGDGAWTFVTVARPS